jgi:hypothetical protein
MPTFICPIPYQNGIIWQGLLIGDGGTLGKLQLKLCTNAQ